MFPAMEAKVEEAYWRKLYEEDSDELNRVMAEIAQLRSEAQSDGPEPEPELADNLQESWEDEEDEEDWEEDEFGIKECDDFIKECDENSDGKISYEEFAHMMNMGRKPEETAQQPNMTKRNSISKQIV